MIVNSTGTQAISNAGWSGKDRVPKATQGYLWTCRASGDEPSEFRLSDARYLTVHKGLSDRFAVVHNFGGDHLKLTAHSHSDPGTELASISIHASVIHTGRKITEFGQIEIVQTGDATVWASLPRSYVGYALGNYQLVSIKPNQFVGLQTFDWFDQTYDKDYQGILGVAEVPGSDLLVVSIQRDSNPIVYDPIGKAVCQKLSLAGRGGNPVLHFRRNAPELLASDYDTLVAIEVATWRVIRSKLIQVPFGQFNRVFMGDYFLDDLESVCVVARPYSRDVVLVSLDNFEILKTVPMEGQPLDVAVLEGNVIVARDWRTMNLLKGRLP